MASITNAKLTISHDERKQLADVRVTCDVRFTALEVCQMRTCEGRHFKLKCQLWGADSGLTGADDHLFTLADVHFFPDGTPTANEPRSFQVTLGEGVLDEDWGTDEVYAKLILQNLATLVQVTRKSNQVSHSF